MRQPWGLSPGSPPEVENPEVYQIFVIAERNLKIAALLTLTQPPTPRPAQTSTACQTHRTPNQFRQAAPQHGS